MLDPNAICLFSYGTLRDAEVQIALFGRLLTGSLDGLPGYRIEMVEITDADVIATSGASFHPIVVPSANPADRVPGAVLILTEQELSTADAYEVSDYVRRRVRLASGIAAWIYMRPDIADASLDVRLQN